MTDLMDELGAKRKRGWTVGLSRLLPLTLLVLFAAPFLFVPIPAAHAGGGGPTVPAGVLYYVPVTLTDSQAAATSSGFQQQLTVNWDTYSTYLNAGVQNVEFFDNGGTILKGWCESSCSNTATSSVVWVNLGSDTIAAGGGTLTVYMGFLSTSTNNMGNTVASVWGEAPQLSLTYGQYDDGANVFSFYDNFAGPTLSAKWVTAAATVTVNNGVKISGSSSTFDLTTASYTVSPPFEMEAYGTLPVKGYSWAVGAGDRAGLNGLGASGFNGQSSPARIQGGQSTPTAQTRAGNYGAVTTTGIWTTEAISSTTSNFYFNYGNKNTVSADAPTYPVYFNLASFLANPSPALSYSWVRVRAYPPSGVMPSASFGTVTGVTATVVACSPSTTVDVGSPVTCTATVTGETGSITGETVTWSQTGGTGGVSFSASTCALSGSPESCPVTVTGATAGSATIQASYPGDSGNLASSGTATLTVDSGLVAGAITPSGPLINSGESITLTADPSGGTPPYFYQWYAGAGCTSPIPGATASTYDTGPLTSSATYYYGVTDSAHSPVGACSPGAFVFVIPAHVDTTGGAYMPVGVSFTDGYGHSWVTPGGTIDGDPIVSYFFAGPESSVPPPMMEGWGGVYGTYDGQDGWIVSFF